MAQTFTLAGPSKLTLGKANELRDLVAKYPYFKDVEAAYIPGGNFGPSRYEVRAKSKLGDWVFISADEFYRAVESIEQVIGPPKGH